jgi:RNA polymerase sigma-70 factor (ECF subfamily)
LQPLAKPACRKLTFGPANNWDFSALCARQRINLNDRELLGALRAGDEAAFDTIFRAYYATLVPVVEGILRERALAEEVVQDVMLELWRRRETLSVTDSLKAYLFQAARNRAFNHIRHRKVEERGFVHLDHETAAPASAHADLVEREIDGAVRAAVAELPPRCREVFELSRVHGLKYAEIARTLDISVKTVEAQMGKALRVLRGRLSAYLPESHDNVEA